MDSSNLSGILKDLEVYKISKQIAQHVDRVTCIECCKPYVMPTTALCGHTLCRKCWCGRQKCPCCAKPVNKKLVTFNQPMQTLTDHVNVFKELLEDLFKIKLDEYLLDTPDTDPEKEPNKIVKEWLASSQNHFSVPPTNSQQSIQDANPCVKQVMSDIHIHTKNKKESIPVEVIHAPQQQLDWDKIEEMPDTEDVSNNNQVNVVEPMDIEPFEFMMDDKEYSTNNPRRSSRKKEVNSNAVTLQISNKSYHKAGTADTNKKSEKSVKTWSNVKRMKKEFSKLNKLNRNKLNVSIEKCIKAQVPTNQINLQTTDSVKPSNENISVDILNNDPIIEQNDLNKDSNEKLEDIIEILSPENKKIKPCNIVEPILQQENNTPKVSFFKKSALQTTETRNSNIQINLNKDYNTVDVNPDDIAITIKIGNILTNINIQKKDNDIQLKVHTDREVQTSLGEPANQNKISVSCRPLECNNLENNQLNKSYVSNNNVIHTKIPFACNILKEPKEKSISIKKNTASAETTTAQFEVSASVEKQLSQIMENIPLEKELPKKMSQTILKTQKNSQLQDQIKDLNNISQDVEDFNDLDIFDSESVKEGHVQSLAGSKQTQSAIIMPTHKTIKGKIQNYSDKREREDENELPSSKKCKVIHENTKTINPIAGKHIDKKGDNIRDDDSESSNYDAIMSQVFANIDADMREIQKKGNHPKITQSDAGISISLESPKLKNTQSNRCIDQKCSENIFSILEKESDETIGQKTNEVTIRTHTQVNTLTEVEAVQRCTHCNDVELVELSTPVQDDASNHSVVEETPQKSLSFTKNKNKNEGLVSLDSKRFNKESAKNIRKPEQVTQKTNLFDNQNVIDISDTVAESPGQKNNTMMEAVRQSQMRTTLETPMTINKFVDHIKHKSTPLARKSLNFDRENIEDPEQTLCPSSVVVAKTTQEREFMIRAFNQTPSPASTKGKRGPLNFCIAGSCLTPSELMNVKLLCAQRNWSYVDKFTEELTHLVVAVDDENKSQRSVKFMCALAAAKWIVSYAWVEKCLQLNHVVNEEPFEALDFTGEPGPRRSRSARTKLFAGITFYCMPPFSVLDVDTLKGMLQAAGGRVAREPEGARVGERPALLLAEPEHTQEDKFIYLAMELSVVPVNFEWVLNCLGSYSLTSVNELLLCPAALLPPVTLQWPAELISRDY